MKKKFRRAFATISCAIVSVTTLGLASACGDPSCEHTWNDGVIKTAATCTTDGEKLLTCTKCQGTKTEAIPMGHNYVNGTCSACGDTDPNAVAGNFYFSLIESLATAETYYVEIPECALTLTDESGEKYITCKEMKLTIGLDENGFLCGEGTIQAIITSALEGSDANEESVELTCQALLEDGLIYLSALGLDGDKELRLEQSELLETLKSDPQALAAINLMETVLAAEEYGELVDSIKDVKDNPLNTVMEAIFEYVYTKQETDDGYVFTLNANRLMDVYNVLEEQTLGGVFNTVFGANAYTNFVDYLVASVDKTIGEFVEEVETKCTQIGVEPETVYSLVNTIANATLGEEAGGDFDISAMLEEYEETPLVEIFNAILGEEHSAQEYKERLQREAANLYNVKALDTLSAEQKYEIEEMLSLIVEEFEKSTIQFYTDKAGNLLSVSYDLKDFGDETMMIGSFKMNVVPGGSFVED